jgi:hypothetical protein
MIKSPQSTILLFFTAVAVASAVGCGDGRRHHSNLRKGAAGTSTPDAGKTGKTGTPGAGGKSGDLHPDQQTAENLEQIQKTFTDETTTGNQIPVSELKEGVYSLESAFTDASYTKNATPEEAFVKKTVSKSAQGDLQFENGDSLSAGLSADAVINLSRILEVPSTFTVALDANGVWTPDPKQANSFDLMTTVSQTPQGLDLKQSAGKIAGGNVSLFNLLNGDIDQKTGAQAIADANKKMVTLKIFKVDETHYRMVITTDELLDTATNKDPAKQTESLGLTVALNYSVQPKAAASPASPSANPDSRTN